MLIFFQIQFATTTTRQQHSTFSITKAKENNIFLSMKISFLSKICVCSWWIPRTPKTLQKVPTKSIERKQNLWKFIERQSSTNVLTKWRKPCRTNLRTCRWSHPAKWSRFLLRSISMPELSMKKPLISGCQNRRETCPENACQLEKGNLLFYTSFFQLISL